MTASAPNSRQTILLVDDIPANLGVLFDTFDAAELTVRVAESGEHALESVAVERPDIILLDVMMPGLDGFATCQRLKADERTAEIPVLFMTALSDVVDKVRGFAAGAVDYITKPLHPEEVLARVQTHLRLRELQRSLEQRNDELDREVQRRVGAERELQKALDRALLVANPAGEVLFCSDQAGKLVQKYFPTVDPRRVPAGLRTNVLPAGLRVQRTPGATSELFVLEEAAPAPTPALLAPLGLTPRETEILFWIAQGKTNAEIAAIIGSAAGTVKKHVENLLPKLGVDTRLSAALKAMELLSRP